MFNCHVSVRPSVKIPVEIWFRIVSYYLHSTLQDCSWWPSASAYLLESIFNFLSDYLFVFGPIVLILKWRFFQKLVFELQLPIYCFIISFFRFLNNSAAIFSSLLFSLLQLWLSCAGYFCFWIFRTDLLVPYK